MKTELNKTLNVLKKGGVIIYPTDTIWGIGCDATDAEAVARIYKLKQRSDSKSMIILVSSMEMLMEYIPKLPTRLHCVLDGAAQPTTVIYQNPKGLASNVIASDNTVGVRIVQDEFCNALIEKFGKPIVSTSANISGRKSPATFDQIDKILLDNVDYVVNLHRERSQGRASRIVKFNAKGGFEFLRK